ncbi:hypothetical protein L6452_36440 [Arctium lappa]|uniref:Uncharacterized protein n=1 Tax=Arctium lappa TaxID=4217 RepID=A0ACB8YDF2_ARCLA|nr:hypothetical protein L6452_36440 [Arctium lappa]
MNRTRITLCCCLICNPADVYPNSGASFRSLVLLVRLSCSLFLWTNTRLDWSRIRISLFLSRRTLISGLV